MYSLVDIRWMSKPLSQSRTRSWRSLGRLHWSCFCNKAPTRSQMLRKISMVKILIDFNPFHSHSMECSPTLKDSSCFTWTRDHCWSLYIRHTTSSWKDACGSPWGQRKVACPGPTGIGWPYALHFLHFAGIMLYYFCASCLELLVGIHVTVSMYVCHQLLLCIWKFEPWNYSSCSALPPRKTR